MNSSELNTAKKYRLSWKGALRLSAHWLRWDENDVLILIIPLLLQHILKVLFSYLRVSAEGLELRYAAECQVMTSWQNIERLGKSDFQGDYFSGDALILKQPAVVEPENKLARLIVRKTMEVIMIGDFHGWPDGELAQRIRQYAPHIFEQGSDGEA